MDTEYQEKRAEIASYFCETNLVEEEREEFFSPCNNYKLVVDEFSTAEGRWTYTRSQVIEVSSGKIISEIKRNYSHFWHAWINHNNGNMYLLCGEDYQGQTVVNLGTRKTQHYFPVEGHNGVGFCWVNAKASPDCSFLAVEGCYWACPYEVVFFDFKSPDSLPYKELGRIDNLADVNEWTDNHTFKMTQEIEVRKADGTPYKDLSIEEREELDNGKNTIDYKIIEIEVDVRDFLKPGY